ncbi:MAG: hypothetical protein DMF61_24810 [Blastocatellia bacterium AA13]|nr:MAG: hypothetical protein DMF61_24810 [Blastocatellia bacterium AA13]
MASIKAAVELDQCIPALRWDARVVVEGDLATFRIDGETVELSGTSPELIKTIAAAADGTKSIRAIADQLGSRDHVVGAVVKALIEAGIAVDLASRSDNDLDPRQFTSICRRLFGSWKYRLFSHPLWELLRSGEATKAQFTGWLIETYHFIEGVNDRLALSIAECADHRIKPLFIRHYFEEYDHSHFFISALRALGYDAALVESTRPLPSTMAVLNHMRNCARRGPLEYAVSSAFLESAGAERASGLTFLERVREHYAPDRPRVIQPLIEHVKLDEAYGHNQMLELVCDKMPRIPRERASEALGLCALFIETLELWSTDIVRYYGAPAAGPRIGAALQRPLRMGKGNGSNGSVLR